MRKFLIAIPVLGLLALVGSFAQQPFGGSNSGSSSGVGGYPLLAPDGTTGAPSYSFSSAPTTGFWLNSGSISFGIAGSSPAFIDSLGINSRRFTTFTNCTSAASPAVCASSAAGSVVIAAAATTVTVNTTIVNAVSQILLTFDSSLSTKLSVTCNTTVPTVYSVSGRVAATSFTITSTAPVTNPACFSYAIIN